MAVVGVAWAEEQVYSTCLFGSNYNSQSVSSYTATWSATNGSFTWSVANGNNNSNAWSYVKFGRKNNTSVGSITTSSAYTEAISKVDVTIDAITANSVNSITLYTSSDNSNWTSAGTFDKSQGTKSVTLSSPAANLYYKVEFDCASGSSNGLVTVSKVEYYYQESGDTPSTAVATTVTIDASGITNTDVYTGTAAGSLSAVVTETESGDVVAGAPVTWTSSKENVATIDEDGVVTLVAAGTTTITASYEGVSGEFGASTATYELTVTSSAPYVQPTEFEIGLNNALFGTEYTGSASGINDENPVVGTQDNVTVTYAGSGNHYVNDSQIRLYPSNKLTFEAPEGYEIKEIVFTADGTWTATISADGGTYVSDTKTWTGSATSVLFTGSGSGHCRMSKAAITLGLPSTDPTIEASDVNIAYDATSGEIAYTINNPVPGTLLQATADADWVSDITVGDEAITFTTTANEANTERVATFTLTYEGAEDKTVTVTQAAAPVVYTTIPDLFAAATSTSTPVAITFNNWVISAVKGSNAYLTDNAGNGLIIYQSGHGFNVNDVLSGTASCNLVTYQGSAELTALTASTEGLTVTAGGTVTEQNIAINELGGVNTGALLAYENLTYNGTALVDADNNAIEPYSTLYSYTFEADKVYNVKGIYKQYTTNTQDKKQILPRSADDIEEVVSEDPAVTLENYNIDVPVEGGDGILTVQYQNIDDVVADIQFYGEDGSEVDANYYEDWLTAELDEDNNVSYIAIENNGEERKAYFKVYSLVGNDFVYSDMITITQEGFSAIRNFTFEQTSATAGTLTNEPEGVTAVFNNTYTNNKEQLTKDNSMTLTIKGMPANYKVTGITLTVKNNASKGSGTATVSIGKKEIGTLDVTGLGGTYGDQDVTIIPSFATSDLVINIAATENSVYCKKFTIEYEIMDYVGVTIKEGFTATTFSCDKALDFSAVEGITAYIITDDKGSTTPVAKVPAGKGLYIVGAAGDYEVPFLADETEAEDVSANWLIPTDGTTEFKSDESVTYYAFGKQNGKEAFYKVPTSGYTPSANKAVLVVNAPASSAKEMIVIGGDVTGIESIENGTIVNDNYYTIDGKLVKGQPTQKGIYVVNGRKVVIK